MRNPKQRLIIYVMIGLCVGLSILPVTFIIGWGISDRFIPSVTQEIRSLPEEASQPVKINLATTKITEDDANIYGELIMICTGSDAIFVQPDGKYFEGANYCGMWSPDGRYMIKSDHNVSSGPDVLFRERGSPDLINITENLPVPGWISFFSWSPDGQYVSIVGWDFDETNNGVYLIDMTSGMPPQKVEFLFHTDETHGIGRPTWSPDGKFIGISNGVNGNPYILDLNGKIIWESPIDLYGMGDEISWSPDSRQFIYTAFTETATAENNDTQLMIGDIRKGSNYPLSLPMKSLWPRWSPDGKWVFFKVFPDELGTGTYLYAISPDGRDLTKLGNSGRNWTIGGWSPDRKRFLLAEDIFSLNLEQKKPDPYADSNRYYLVDLDGFKKELFFQNDSFSYMQLSVYPLIWLPAIKDIEP